MRVHADLPSSPRRPRWTMRELSLLALSVMLILSPLGALAFAMLQPTITVAQTAPNISVTKVATSLGGIDLEKIPPGGEFYYEIRVGSSSAEPVNLTLLDSFPGTVQALTITDRKGGTCTLTANQLSCSLVTSSANEASVLVRTRASTTATNGTEVTNTVLVTAGGASARGSSTLTITGPGNQPSPTIAAITATTAPPTNTAGPTNTAVPNTAVPNTAVPTNTAQAPPPTSTATSAPTNTAAATTPTATDITPSATPTAAGPSPTRRADEATATSAALTVVPVATASATAASAATAAATAAATTPTATAEFTVTPTAESTLVSQGTTGPTTVPSTPTGTPEAAPPTAAPATAVPATAIPATAIPATAIPATVIPTLTSPNTSAPTPRPAAPTSVPPAGGSDSNVPPADGGSPPPPASGGKEPPATSPDVTGRTLPATSGEQWLWLLPLLGLVLLLHTVRVRRARVS